MIISFEANHADKIDRATTSDEGKCLLENGFLSNEVIETAKEIDVRIKVALVELKRQIYFGSELESAVNEYVSATDYLKDHEGEAYATERMFEAGIRLQAILKSYDRNGK